VTALVRPRSNCTVNYRPVLSSERVPDIKKTSNCQTENKKTGHGLQMGDRHYDSTTEPNRLMLFTVRTIRNTQIQSVPHRTIRNTQIQPVPHRTIRNTQIQSVPHRTIRNTQIQSVPHMNHTEHTDTVRTSQNHTEHTDTLCGQTADIFTVEAGGNPA
jgi:hypothetical protein